VLDAAEELMHRSYVIFHMDDDQQKRLKDALAAARKHLSYVSAPDAASDLTPAGASPLGATLNVSSIDGVATSRVGRRPP
jgi:hypothetical protein